MISSSFHIVYIRIYAGIVTCQIRTIKQNLRKCRWPICKLRYHNMKSLNILIKECAKYLQQGEIQVAYKTILDLAN